MPDTVALLNDGPLWSDRWLHAVAWRQADERDTVWHAHAHGQLIGSLDGVLSVRAAAGRWVVPRSYAIWVPPSVSHAMRSHGPFAGWSLYFGGTACEALPIRPCAVRVEPLLNELVARTAEWGQDPWDAARRRLAAVVLDEVAAAPPAPLALPEPVDVCARQVAAGILADLADNRTADAWARTVASTSRTLARRFRTETGLGLSEWRQRARILRATEMLAEGRSVTAVALDMGYATTGAFIDMFKRYTGTTPGRSTRGPQLLSIRR